MTIGVGGGFRPDELLAEIRTARAYRDLTDGEWRWVMEFVTRGGSALSAYPEYNKIVERDGRYVARDRMVAMRHRMSIGTIVSEAAMKVAFVRGKTIGTVEENFIARLRPGDVFTFAGRTLGFVRVREMTAWVRSRPRAHLGGTALDRSPAGTFTGARRSGAEKGGSGTAGHL